MSLINFPILYIPDPVKGRPLFNGQIYVGIEDLDPQVVANQKQLNVIEENGTVVPVAQPFILSAGGVPVYNGNPVRLDVTGNYSIKILSKLGVQVYYIENAFQGDPVTINGNYTTNFLTLTDALSSMDESRIYAGAVVSTKELTTGNGYPAIYDVVAGVVGVDGFHINAHDTFNLSLVQRDKNNIASVLSYPAGLTWGANRWEISQPITITSGKDLFIDGEGEILFDNGVQDSDSDGGGIVRRFLGIAFNQCENVTVKNFVLQSNTSVAGGNGVILNSVPYSNHLRFFQCTNVTTDNLTLDYRTNKPDSAYISEASFVNDLLRSFPLYYVESNGVKMLNCGVSRTNDTGEIIGYRNCSDVTIHGFYTLSGIASPSTHSALFKVMLCSNVDIGYLNVQTAYNGTMMDVSGNHIRIHDFHVENVQGGIVDVTREFGPSGGPVSNVTIENVSTSGSNLISTAPATGVLEANTGNTYSSLDNPISKIRVINCETGNDTHPLSDKRSGVNHAIDSTDIFDGIYFEGRQKRIKNPESLVQRLTSADTALNYEFTVVGYEYYQDEVAQSWDADCTVGGIGRFVDCQFNFSSTVAEPNKSLLTLNDVRLTNGDAGITPQNTTAKLIFEDCDFKNVTLTIKCNVEFINCEFINCIILDGGIANLVTFDKDCTARLRDDSISLVGTDTGGFATFIYFESIGEWSWHGTVTGEYVIPAGYGVMGSIKSSGQRQNFKGASFDVVARASTGGASVEDYCVFHWDRNDNATCLELVTNSPRRPLMVLVRANVGGTSTTARLDVIGCSTRGKLLRDSGTFTNSSLMMVSNNCNTTNQTGTWTTTVLTPNVVGLT